MSPQSEQQNAVVVPISSPESLASPIGSASLDPRNVANYNRGRRRTGISAEPVHFLEQKDDEPVMFPKSEDEKRKILDCIEDNILFSSLDSKQMNILLDAMQAKSFGSGTNIITQGQEGDYFIFLMKERRVVSCLKKESRRFWSSRMLLGSRLGNWR